MADDTYTVVHETCQSITTGIGPNPGNPVWCRKCGDYFPATEFKPWQAPVQAQTRPKLVERKLVETD